MQNQAIQRDDIPPYAQVLRQLALQKGAAEAVPFVLADIAFDERTLMKCMFGCLDWGRGPTCPSRPGFPSLEQWRRMLSQYRWGVICHAGDKRSSQIASLALESRAFHDGYYFAFSLSDCGLCPVCAGKADDPACRRCRDPLHARPAFHAVGIDVFKTVRALGMTIQTLPKRDAQPQNWYSAVFVE